MPQETSELADLARLIDETPLPDGGQGVELLAVSHDTFQARWSLTEDIVRKGRSMASPSQNETHLVLRAFSLPPDANGDAVSGIWQDFNIEGTDNSGYFTLSGPTSGINAAVGLVNKDGRFSPLLRGESIDLPALPVKALIAKPEPAAKTEPEPESVEQTFTRPTEPRVLDEKTVTERLAQIDGLPETFKVSAKEALTEPQSTDAFESLFKDAGKPAIEHPPQTEGLDEAEVLDAVRNKLAAEQAPEIEKSVQKHINAATTSEASGASEQLASQWEELWSDKAPIEIRAEYILTGKMANGMKLLLGNDIVEPTAGGYFVWKRRLSSFDQVWPILQAAIQTPSVPAGPSLEFFHEVQPSQRLLELHGALEIEGHVSDPNYFKRLPEELHVNESGTFKLSRMLPDGAVVLPGISLIAG
ncbi:MAG: hypothetical protein AAF065_08310 [Verrucomicrobiota bacterium]